MEFRCHECDAMHPLDAMRIFGTSRVCIDCNLELLDCVPAPGPRMSQRELEVLLNDPQGWLKRAMKSRNRFGEGYWYLLTFTRNPNSRYTKQQWLDRVKRELLRASVTECRAAIEHEDSNVHVHAVTKFKHSVTKRLFDVFSRDYGFVDVRRVKVDNGVQAYIEKELPGGNSAVQPSFLQFSPRAISGSLPEDRAIH